MNTVGRTPELVALAEALAAPFEPREVKWKAQTVKNNRALAVAFIDARLIQDRLDEALGVENWSDTYRILPDGSVVCRLRCNMAGRWVTKTDVGSPSEQPDGGDRLKAAFSDALKRAAVKFGIGRYLYRLPAQWVDYDPVKKQILQAPQLPAFGLPKKSSTTAPAKPQPRPAAQVPTTPTDLVAAYNRAADDTAFAGLEDARKRLWDAASAGDKLAMKTASDAARKRLTDSVGRGEQK